jgi:hypothetical protein
MSERTIRYTKGEIGKLRVVKDFLPPPEALVLAEDNVKVTLSLTRRSIAFFKRTASTRRLAHQRTIDVVVDESEPTVRAERQIAGPELECVRNAYVPMAKGGVPSTTLPAAPRRNKAKKAYG